MATSGHSLGITRQAPLAAVGCAAIALIVLIHASQPQRSPVEQPAAVAMCAECGTVVALRRSAHATPVYFADIQMTDGSLRTVQLPSASVSVGDVVQVTDNGLSLRPV